MKKIMFFALVMFMSVIGAVFGQTPATLPYTCDFEAAGDNGWTLKNGTCTNKWHVGSFTSPAGHSGSLFISSDGGTTAGYNTTAESVVVAEKLFQTGTGDSLTISFDLTVEGETYVNDVYDYLKVFWVPADTVYQASTSWTYYAADASYSTNVIMSNATSASNYTLNLTNGVERMSVTIANEPNTLKKLVFVWVNDDSDGEQPGAIIDNISIIAPPTLTPLPYSCDFEAAGDNGWTLKNGTCTNKWHVGSFTSPAGHSGSLFISSDGGTTAGYNINATSVVVAEKLFQTGTSDSLTISFDLTVKGEGIYDYLKVFWVDTNVNYEASALFLSPNYASYDYSNNVIMGTTYLNNLSATTRMSTTIANEPNTSKKLVFVWRNDQTNGGQPGAIIDNISIIATLTPTPLPYSCDFEAAGDNGWTLKNGTCTNKWHVGSFTSPAGHSGSLFISSDGGTTAGYDVDAESVVVAEKLFQTGTSDSLTISFDLTIGGEEDYDYLKVFWVPADTVYEASTSLPYYYADTSYSTNVIMSNAISATNYTVNMLIGTQNMSATIANEPNTLKKLVFVWKNDFRDGEQPGAIIDNIYISDCIIPTDFIASNITQTSADVSWNGTASSYEVRLNSGTPETVSTTSKTFTGLTAGTAYTVEVRSLCGSNNSAWKRIEFYTSQLPTPLPYTCDFEATGDNGWLLKNVTYTNQWHVGSFTSPAGHSGSLFISSDGGTTADYDIDAYSVVVAEKLFQTGTSDSLTISFDLTIGGEEDYDYLKVFWVPADTVYQASISTPYFANAKYSTNIIMSNATSATNYTVNMLTGTQNMSATIANEPNTLKKLVFVWVNDYSDGCSPGAIIDNISITLAASGLADAESGAIKAMIYPNPAKDKATLSLTGLTANAKIIVSDLQGRIIQTEDLQAGTETYELNTSNYASGVYYIRILCGNNVNTQKLIVE